MTRLASFWHDITEGHSLGTLWLDFKREARSSFETSAPELSPGAVEVRGLRRVWLFARVLFFRLTPARRVLLLFAVLLLISFRAGSGEEARRDSGGVILSALCLLIILALEVADRVAMKRDLEVARDIQNWLVPKSPPQLPGLDIAFATRPANTVAGDYYDVLSLPAAGSDNPASPVRGRRCRRQRNPGGSADGVLSSQPSHPCRHRRRLVQSGGSPEPLLLRRQSRRPLSHYGIPGAYHPVSGSLSYINAGHNPPLLRCASGSLLELEAGGLPCGAFADARYDVGQAMVQPGDVLLIYTDGVVDAVNEAGDEFGLNRLRAFVREEFCASATFQQRLFASIDAFTGKARQFDDITCMVIRRTGG